MKKAKPRLVDGSVEPTAGVLPRRTGRGLIGFAALGTGIIGSKSDGSPLRDSRVRRSALSEINPAGDESIVPDFALGYGTATVNRSMKMGSQFLWAISAAFCVQVFSTPAWAEDTKAPAAPPAGENTQAPAPPPQAAPSAPDTVRLKNGAIFKGTISELVPNDYVVIVTLTGESRRFSMSEVEYAGAGGEPPRSYPEPDAAAPAPQAVSSTTPTTRPAVTVHAAEARVSLTSEPDGRTFHRQTATATVKEAVDGFEGVKGYDELCTSPCEVSMAAGTTTLAVSEPGGQVVGAAPVTIPPGRSEVHAVWVDESGTRTTGRVLIGVGIAGAVAVLGVAVASESNDTGMLVGLVTGTVATSVVFGIGVGLAGTPDSATFEVRAATSAPERERKLASREGTRVPGLTLSGAF